MSKVLDRFFAGLQTAQYGLLLLDYDGTLAPFREKRDEAIPYPGVENRLDELIASKTTTVVIISGRAIRDLKPLLHLKTYPEIWGSHGWEHCDKDGVYTLRRADPESLRKLAEAKKYIEDSNLTRYLEEKPVSLAIHYRGVDPDKTLEIKHKISHHWEELLAGSQLTCAEFDGGLELKLPRFTKGDVVKGILERYPKPPVTAYLGDDLTDEDAFRALPESGVGVLVRTEQRPSAAKAWIQPPDAMLAFLDRWLKIDSSR
ncbi:MAG: trehalose-phosphatase [candidate division Zixibacteria bacterium]|nr:trehalose-phosphatase [candidate division Zixibacteria bacterium]